MRLEGRNAVLEALNSNSPIDKIYFIKGQVEGSLKLIAAKAHEQRVITSEIDKAKFDAMAVTANNQGVIAVCPAKAYVEVDDILERARAKNEQPFIIILDRIKDPHNLGAVIRTAEAAGVHGVIISKHESVGLTATVAKTSSGAIEYMPVARVTNVTHVINALKKQNVWVGCADMDGYSMYTTKALDGAVALVIGSEGEGVSPLVAKSCDFTVKIPMYGKISSLNASVAASVLMYEVVRRRHIVE